MNYERLAIELLQALRGNRSRAQLSRRLGYRSNVAHRWETGRSSPSVARYLQHHRKIHPQHEGYFERFFLRVPSCLEQLEPESEQAVAAFLREIRGKTPITVLARGCGFNRYQVSRWLSGATEPRLPEFLRLVDFASRRLLDLVAIWEDPARLPSAARSWKQLQAARQAAYDQPWSHAVLRALEVDSDSTGLRQQVNRLAECLDVDAGTVEQCLRILALTGQVKKSRGQYRPQRVAVVNTSQDPALGRALKLAWTRTAADRLERRSPGSFGYSLFAISRADLRRLRDLHMDYVRAMQQLIAASEPAECVGLYCSQLLDLGKRNNALESPAASPRRR
jgi:transcriptional regulator with XRE-family HTH domain